MRQIRLNNAGTRLPYNIKKTQRIISFVINLHNIILQIIIRLYKNRLLLVKFANITQNERVRKKAICFLKHTFDQSIDDKNYD